LVRVIGEAASILSILVRRSWNFEN